MHTLMQWTLLYKYHCCYRLLLAYSWCHTLSHHDEYTLATPIIRAERCFLLYFLPFSLRVCRKTIILSIRCLFLGIIQACEIGNEYSSEDEVSDIEGKWFLNVAIPANCSGSINKYRFWLYEDNLNDETVYDITLAIWKPINSTTYEIVSEQCKCTLPQNVIRRIQVQ